MFGADDDEDVAEIEALFGSRSDDQLAVGALQAEDRDLLRHLDEVADVQPEQPGLLRHLDLGEHLLGVAHGERVDEVDHVRLDGGERHAPPAERVRRDDAVGARASARASLSRLPARATTKIAGFSALAVSVMYVLPESESDAASSTRARRMPACSRMSSDVASPSTTRWPASTARGVVSGLFSTTTNGDAALHQLARDLFADAPVAAEDVVVAELVDAGLHAGHSEGGAESPSMTSATKVVSR